MIVAIIDNELHLSNHKVFVLKRIIIITDVDECSSNPCQHNGTCVDLINMYTCICQAGYTGDNCDIGMNKIK